MKHTHERVLIKVNPQSKNSHLMSNGVTLIMDRDVENLNKRETMPVNAVVISADDIPSGAQVLIHHNSVHDSNRVFDADDTKEELYYSIPHNEVFLWKKHNEKEWNPMKGFATALRIYKPYAGVLDGIDPGLVNGVLYICSGELNGNACHVVKASDYEIVFQGDDGREKRIIRLRHFENEINPREEVLAINEEITNKVKNGELLIGLTASKSEKLK